MTIGIYCIENTKNNKKYIGSSIDIERRLVGHRCKLNAGEHENENLQNSYFKYGKENFRFFILEETLEENLVERENNFIYLYDTISRSKGYNMKDASGRELREESRKKMSRTHTEEEKRIVSEKMKGIPKTEEWKNKVRKPKTEEWKRKIGDSHLYKKEKNSKSKYLGVSYNKNKDNWISSIRINGNKIYLGVFNLEEEAAVIYNIAARFYLGENAKINIIE